MRRFAEKAAVFTGAMFIGLFLVTAWETVHP